MSQAIILKGGAGGVGSDDVTASKAQVLQGYKTVTTDSDDEIAEGTMVNRGNGMVTVEFGDAYWENKFFARMEQGYYAQVDQWKPYVSIPYAVLANGIHLDANKMLDTFTVSGVRGAIPVRGYHGPDSGEMWFYPQESGYVIRIEEGYYHKSGDGLWKPYVLASPSLVKSAVNYHPEKTLSDTKTCEEQGQIKMVNTQDNNYRVNKSGAFGIDNWTDRSNPVFWIDFPHGNGYYYRADNHPHACIDASNLGTADANSVLQWQTATSQYGVKFEGAIPRWVCGTGDVISAVDNNGFAWDDTTGANRGRGIVTKIPNGHFIQGANYVFLPAPNLYPQNVRAGVNINGVVGTMVDYSVGRPVFENATFNTLYVGGVANKDFPEAGIYRERTQSHNNYSKYIGGTTIDVRAGSNYHLSAFSNYVGFILDRAILFTFFRQLKVTYKLNMNMHTGRYNRTAGVNIFVFIYDANNRSRNMGGNQATHRSGDNIESVHNENTYELIVDTSMINQDGFVALCADAYSDDNLSSAIGNVTFTKIELIN